MKISNPLTLLTASSLLATLPYPAVAQDSTIELNPVVVTGTRTEKLQSDSPVKTEVITREEIRANHARDVKEALEDIPGLLLKRIHGKSGYEVWLQGLDSNRVKVLIDGEPVAASTGSSVDVTQISTLDIERIEIVKGATSALYGSAAMGGVINIITRPIEAGLHYEALAEGGSYGKDNPGGKAAEVATGRVNGQLSYGSDVWYSGLSIDQRTSDGFDATPDTWTTEGAEGDRTSIGARLGFTPTDKQRYEINSSFYREDLTNRLAVNNGGRIDLKNKDEEAERLRLGGRFDIDSELGQFSGTALYEQFEDLTWQDIITTPQKEDPRSAEFGTQRATLNWSDSLGDAHLITTGVEYFRETLEQYKDDEAEVPPGTERTSIAWFIQDDFFLTDSLEVVPGLRLQDDSDFGGYAAPKINLRQELGSLAGWNSFVRIGYGRGYRVPNLKERYYTFDHSHIGYMVLGNADLEPESSNSYQLGFGANNGRGSYVDLNVFYNDITDLIDTAFDAVRTNTRTDNVAIYSYVNIDEARTYGAELSAAYRLSDAWRLHGGYTYLESEDERTGLTLPNRPRHLIKGGVRYRASEWRTEIVTNVVYQSEEYTDLPNQNESPDWTTVDFKITQPVTGPLSVYGGIDNLTDVQRDFSRPQTDVRPEEGRFFYLGLRLEG